MQRGKQAGGSWEPTEWCVLPGRCLSLDWPCPTASREPVVCYPLHFFHLPGCTGWWACLSLTQLHSSLSHLHQTCVLAPPSPLPRLDSLVGLFAAKCAPTATADPYGLRRSAVGMLQVRASRAMGQGPVHLPAAACAVGHAVLTGGGVAHAPPPFSKRLALS